MSSDEKNMDSIESMASAIMRSAHSGNQHGVLHTDLHTQFRESFL